MKTIKTFKIKENEAKFDTVKLIKDESNCKFIVQWKWATMKKTLKAYYESYEKALEKYEERKEFAIMCNSEQKQ